MKGFAPNSLAVPRMKRTVQTSFHWLQKCFAVTLGIQEITMAADMTRREYFSILGGSVGSVVLGPPLIGEVAQPAQAAAGAYAVPLTIHINGAEQRMTIDPRVTLLDLLRERLGLTGTKKGCDHGQCGACTVLVNGRRINICLSLAVSHDGDQVTTIEGLAHGGELQPIQAALSNTMVFSAAIARLARS